MLSHMCACYFYLPLTEISDSNKGSIQIGPIERFDVMTVSLLCFPIFSREVLFFQSRRYSLWQWLVKEGESRRPNQIFFFSIADLQKVTTTFCLFRELT